VAQRTVRFGKKQNGVVDDGLFGLIGFYSYFLVVG